SSACGLRCLHSFPTRRSSDLGGGVRVTIGVILLVLVTVTVTRRQLARRREAAAAAEAERLAAAADPGGSQPAESAPGGPQLAASARGGPQPVATPPGGSQPGALAAAQGVGYGLLGGFTTQVANAAGPVMSLYFYAMRMPVLTFLVTSAWYFAIVNLFKVPFSAGLGLITRDTLVMDAMLIPVVLLGALAGSKVARRIPQKVLDRKSVVGEGVCSALSG